MTLKRLLLRFLGSAVVAILILALFGELRPGGALFLIATTVLFGLAVDVARYRRS